MMLLFTVGGYYAVDEHFEGGGAVGSGLDYYVLGWIYYIEDFFYGINEIGRILSVVEVLDLSGKLATF